MYRPDPENALGFEPRVSLKAGIKRVYEWFMKPGIDSIRNAHVLSGSEWVQGRA